MNPNDRYQGQLPARHVESTPARTPHEVQEYAPPIDPLDMATSGKRITAKLVARAIRRHWWQAALVWLVGSLGLMALAYIKVKPSYMAFAQVRVEQSEEKLFTQNSSNSNNSTEFKETQVKIITGPNVLEAALGANPNLLGLPRFVRSESPIDDMRSALVVGIVPKTNLIEIAMYADTAMEATMVVNAVVMAYEKQANDRSTEETRKKTERLREDQLRRTEEVAQKRKQISERVERTGMIDEKETREKNSITLEGYSRISEQLIGVRIAIVEAEARQIQIQGEQAAAASAGPAADASAVDAEIEDTFHALPQVAEVRSQISQTQSKYKQLRRTISDPSDPALMRLVQTSQAANADLNAMKAKLLPRIAAKIRKERPGGVAIDPALAEAERTVAMLKAKEGSLTEQLDRLKVQRKTEGSDALGLEFERVDLRKAEEYLATLDKTLEQIQFESKNPYAKIRIEFLAKESSKQATNNRAKIMAVVPVAMLFGVLSLMVFLELNAGRVVDPDDVQTRVRVPVIGVVPPLPQIRQQGALFSSRDEFRTQRQLDQFVQSLDHLRVALTSSRAPNGRDRRCILITSAVGAEGKTTLAAQLAERCVNAGLLTLLIDGDLRNPTLSRMLDVPNVRGLINVLRGEVDTFDAISVVGGAGGFHFMPSGTPKVDPSRLLQGDKIGQVLAAARERYDLVIVDAPPVLPVPDALTMGRWTDGAVLAVRFDTSRFPLVEKANRRLASVGVPVIGAVVNGVPVVDAAYGSYYPSYSYSNDKAADTPLDV